MKNISHTLAVARRKAGLSQADCAHLLGASHSHVSRLESGKTAPTSADLIGISILFGRSVEAMHGYDFACRAKEIRERLQDLPSPQRNWLGQFNRDNSLDGLSVRLERIIASYDG